MCLVPGLGVCEKLGLAETWTLASASACIPSMLTLLTLTLGPCWGRWWMLTAGRSRDGWCGGPEAYGGRRTCGWGDHT